MSGSGQSSSAQSTAATGNNTINGFVMAGNTTVNSAQAGSALTIAGSTMTLSGALTFTGAGNVVVNSNLTSTPTTPGLLEGHLAGSFDTTTANNGVALLSSSTASYVPGTGQQTGKQTVTVISSAAQGQTVINVGLFNAVHAVIGSTVTGTNVPASATISAVTSTTITINTPIAAPAGIAPGTVLTFSTIYGGSTSNFTAGETNLRTTDTPAGPWFLGTSSGNDTWVYTGQFFTPTGQYAFAEQVDDSAQIKVDGVVLDTDGSFNTATTTGVQTTTPGWHQIEVRFGNGGGGAGASGAGTGWTASYGFGAQGVAGAGQAAKPVIGGLDGSTYLNVIDSGAGEVFHQGTFSGIAVAGTGTVTLNGANTISGNTTVTSGILEVNGTISSSSGAIGVTNGTLAGNGTIAPAVIIGQGGILSPGQSGGSAVGILNTGSLNFAAVVPAPQLKIQVNGGTVPGTNYDQLNVTGTVTLNSAVLSLNVNPAIADATGTNYAFINNDLTDSAVGSFAGINFGDTINASGKAFTVNNNLVAPNTDNVNNQNDVGLTNVFNLNLYASRLFNTSGGVFDPTNPNYQGSTFSDSNPLSPTYTGGETISLYDSVNNPNGTAFPDIQTADSVYGTATAIVVDAGSYTATTISNTPNIVLSGGSVIISRFDVTAAGAKLQIPATASLTINTDGSSTSFLGSLTGSGTFILANGGLAVGQVNPFTGLVEIQAGATLTAGLGTTAGSLGTGTVQIDAGATFLLAEPGIATAPTTIASNISSGSAGAGLIKIIGSASRGAVVLSGTNSNYTGSLVINGGRFAAASIPSLGSMSQVLVTNAGQFSYGTLTNANMSMPLTLDSTGFTDANGTSPLLFTGTTNTWSGPVTLVSSARIDAISPLGGSGTIAGDISGPAGVNLQIGGGTSVEAVILAGNNSYSGATIVANNATCSPSATAQRGRRPVAEHDRLAEQDRHPCLRPQRRVDLDAVHLRHRQPPRSSRGHPCP